MEYHEHGGGKLGWQAANQLLERIDTASGCADDDYVPLVGRGAKVSVAAQGHTVSLRDWAREHTHLIRTRGVN